MWAFFVVVKVQITTFGFYVSITIIFYILLKDARLLKLSSFHCRRQEKGKFVFPLISFRRRVLIPMNETLIFKPTLGYCIRCRKIVKYHLEKPMCTICVASFNKDQDMDTEENYCYQCSKENKDLHVTYFKPICDTCDQIWVAEFFRFN